MKSVTRSARVVAGVLGALLLTSGAAAPEIRAPDLQTFDLTPVTGRAAGTPERRTEPFALLGATWTDPKARLKGTVEVRTRSVATGAWAPWRALEGDDPSPADGGRGRTDPLWVGTSDGVQARVAGTDRMPDGLRLDLINPDLVQAGKAPEVTSRAAVPARPVPKMVTRSGWGANESIVKDPPEFADDVQAVILHHTAGTNSYSCADSARIVRGIQLYQVRSNGWNDIGYNFLVDKCGTIFEGRAGGVGRAVLGAHALGFNTRTSGIAVLGDYRSRGVTARVKTAVAQVAAYKLGAYGNLPAGRTTLLSGGSDRYPEGELVPFYRVLAHRDTGRTECPGDSLYAQVPSIRAMAGAAPAGLRLLKMTGAVASGSAYYTKGLISPLWTTTTPSALINRFDVLVDGKVVQSAINSHRKATLRLSPGEHTVSVRATHLSGRAASFTRTVIVDATAPAFSMGPALVLRRGSLSSSIPVRLGWSVADTGGLRSVALTRPKPRNLGVTATGWDTFAVPAVATTWTMRAADRAGNLRDASVTRTPAIVSEATATRTGSWTVQRNSAYLGGSALRSAAGGSSLSWTVTGRSAALAASRTTGSGSVTVYLDGEAAGTVSLRSATAHRQGIWAKNWGASGTHTIKVVATGTVTLDGLVVLR